MPESRTRKRPTKTTPPRRSPAKKGASSVADFKSRKPEPNQTVLTLPSGLSIGVDRSNVMGAFLKSGVIPNPLMEKIQTHLEEGTELTEEEAMKMAQDPAGMQSMLNMLDETVISVCVEPEVYPVPKKGRRAADKLYIDEIDDTDRMFIFQWATGGTSDLDRFRGESQRDVAALLRGQGAGGPAF